jgi:hypothetical protein
MEKQEIDDIESLIDRKIRSRQRELAISINEILKAALYRHFPR